MTVSWSSSPSCGILGGVPDPQYPGYGLFTEVIQLDEALGGPVLSILYPHEKGLWRQRHQGGVVGQENTVCKPPGEVFGGRTSPADSMNGGF